MDTRASSTRGGTPMFRPVFLFFFFHFSYLPFRWKIAKLVSFVGMSLKLSFFLFFSRLEARIRGGG